MKFLTFSTKSNRNERCTESPSYVDGLFSHLVAFVLIVVFVLAVLVILLALAVLIGLLILTVPVILLLIQLVLTILFHTPHSPPRIL